MKYKIILSLVVLFLLVSCDSSITRRFKQAKRLSKTGNMEKWEEAIREFDEIIKIQVNAREYQALIYRKLGKRHMEMEHWNDSLENYKKAAEILPNEGYLHYRIGVCYSQLSRSEKDEEKKMSLIQEAEKEYHLAISLNDKLIDPYYGLGIINFYVYKNYNKGMEYMAEVLRRDSKNIDAHFALARFYYEIGESRHSLEFYKALLSLVPENDQRYPQVNENIQRIQAELRGSK
ncbi:MAG: hypothetical protein KKH98_12295 [Spirochaetes bacterium]|nr:hypothetical protein [Spirochaetota bacterium]